MASSSPTAYVTLEESTTGLTEPTEKTALSFNNESETYGTSFEKEYCRLGFIQKVLSIKLLQAMAVTAIMAGFVGGGYSVYRVMVYHMVTRINFIVLSTLILLAVVASFHFCKRTRTEYPYCYIFLAAYPLSGGLFVCVILYGWALESMLVSWGQFNIIMLTLLLYSILSLETKIEFKTSTALYITGFILIVTYAFTVPFTVSYDINGFAVLYGSLMMFLTTAYILYDLEDMVSKGYHTPLTPADFVKAAVLMHVDHRYLLTKIYNRHKRASMNVYD